VDDQRRFVHVRLEQHGIKAKTTRKFVVTTDSRHSLPVAPDLVQRRFNPEAPSQLWSGDITYIQTDEGWLYLAAVIDLFCRQVVGWSLQSHMHDESQVYQRQGFGAGLGVQETDAFGDAGYQGVDRRPDANQNVRWHVAMRPGSRRALDKDKPVDALIDQLERTKASIRARVEHPFRVLKQQFGYVKVRYRGLKKNTAQFVTPLALSNLWMARHKLLACMG